MNNNQGNSVSMPERKVYDLMSSASLADLEQLIHSIKLLYVNPNTGVVSKNFAIFLVAPEVVDFDLNKSQMCYLLNDDELKGDKKDEYEKKMSDKLVYQLMTTFRFHVTFEHLEEHLNYINCQFKLKKNANDTDIDYEKRNLVCYLNKCKKTNFLNRIINSFSLNFYQIII